MLTPKVSKFGGILPLAITGGAMLTIGSGLTSTLKPSSSITKWVGYQILAGGGRGIVQQIVSP
jgi:hypothetical protein